MKGLFLVEPVIALYAFSLFLIYPLEQQYVYRRFWQKLTNTTYPASNNTSRCTSNNTNHSNYIQAVQRQTSIFFLYTDNCSILSSLLVTLMLVAYSDRGGRKITILIPSIGALIYISSFLTISYFELNVYLLIGSRLLSSLCGGVGTFIGGTFAYIADLCDSDRQKTLRIGGVEMIIGLLLGLASLSTGYFLRAAGFNWPLLTSALCQCLVLLYIILILEETVTKAPIDAIDLNGAPQGMALKQTFYAIYHLFERASSRRRTILILLNVILMCTRQFSTMPPITLYELNEPLCWSEILIGYGTALSAILFMLSFLALSAFMYCGMPQLVIILVGILSSLSGLILIGFANTTLRMFLASIPMVFSGVPYPVLRSMMSKIVSKSEQGALFACISCLEIISSSVAGAVFNSVYGATVTWFPGFTFFLCAGLYAIPLTFLGVLAKIGVDVSTEVDSSKPLDSEENPVEDQNDNRSLLS